MLGIEGEKAKDYALDVIRSDFEEPGDDDVLRKLTADLKFKASESEIRSQLLAFMIKAKEQLRDEL